MTAMDGKTSGGSGAKPVPPLEPDIASFLRRVCTMFELHRRCPYKVCRRANACATRHVVCYQSMEAEMQPIAQSIIARIWRRSLDAGEERDVAPAYRDGFLRRLAREEEEIPRIRSGELRRRRCPYRLPALAQVLGGALLATRRHAIASDRRRAL